MKWNNIWKEVVFKLFLKWFICLDNQEVIFCLIIIIYRLILVKRKENNKIVVPTFFFVDKNEFENIRTRRCSKTVISKTLYSEVFLQVEPELVNLCTYLHKRKPNGFTKMKKTLNFIIILKIRRRRFWLLDMLFEAKHPNIVVGHKVQVLE